MICILAGCGVAPGTNRSVGMRQHGYGAFRPPVNLLQGVFYCVGDFKVGVRRVTWIAERSMTPEMRGPITFFQWSLS